VAFVTSVHRIRLMVRMPLATLLVVVACFAVAASDAGAAPFGAPQPLFVRSTSFASFFNLEAAGDAGGNALAVVRDGSSAGGLLVIERSQDGGWAAPVALAGEGVRQDVAVVAAGDGAAAIVWRRFEPDGKSAIEALVRSAGGSFAGPLVVAGPQLGRVIEPRVAVAGDGTVVVAFLVRTGRKRSVGRVGIAVRAPLSQQFSRPMLVTRALVPPPTVALSADGYGLVAWKRRGRIEAVGIQHGRPGTMRVLGRQAFGLPSVAMAAGGDAVVAWTGREGPVSEGRNAITAAVRRGPAGFGAARSLERVRFAPGVTAAAGPRGRFVLAWYRPDVPSPTGHVRAATAGPRARRFGGPYDVTRQSATGFPGVTLAGTPRGFVAVWPVPSDATHSVWRAALAGDDGRLTDAGTLASPFHSYFAGDVKIVRAFGDRTGRVAILWVQPPDAPPTPPSPPQPGAPPPPPPPPIRLDYTLMATDAKLPS
jgi:hypothetical protein